MVAGVVLAKWITVQMAMIGLGHPIQPNLFVAGVVIARLGGGGRGDRLGGDMAPWGPPGWTRSKPSLRALKQGVVNAPASTSGVDHAIRRGPERPTWIVSRQKPRGAPRPALADLIAAR